MDERRRFAVALSGVLGSIGLAAGIALTGPGVRTVAPRVEPSGIAASRPLPALSLPDWPESVSAPAPVRQARQQPPRALSSGARSPLTSTTMTVASDAAPAPVVAEVVRVNDTMPGHAWGPEPLRATTHTVVIVDAPHASAETALASAERRSNRGPVTTAFVVAGSEVGSGFRTVGRTLKRLF